MKNLGSISKRLPAGVSSLGLAILCAGAFAALAESILHERGITRFDERQAEQCFHFTVEHPLLWKAAERVTEFGGVRILLPLVLGVAFLLLLDRQPALALIWVLVQWASHELVRLAKEWFDRARPCWNQELCRLSDLSFPSGHSCGAMTMYGLLAYFILLRSSKGYGRWVASATLGMLILLVGGTRMMLGVHYFTDVVGGFLLGLMWIMLAAGAIARLPERFEKGS